VEIVTARWIRDARARERAKLQSAVASARRRVDNRYDLVDGGQVGELCTGALLLKLADAAEGKS
jgi:hypothetical protein